MPSMTHLLRSLGNDGALDNVRAVLEARQREEWLVAVLTRRLDARDEATAASATDPQVAAVA